MHGTRIASFASSFEPVDSIDITSDTKELRWLTSHRDSGMVAVETPRTQALIGFLAANGTSVRNLAARLDTKFATLVLSSLDGKPIVNARRLLLTAGSRVSNTALRWNAERTRTTDQGGPPSLIEPVSGSITLRDIVGARSVSISALDGSGKPIGPPTAAARSAAGWTFPIGAPVTTWYVITVARK